MQYRPHLLCKIYIILTSKLEKLVMVQFFSAITLTSLKFQKCMCRKEHLNIDGSRTDWRFWRTYTLLWLQEALLSLIEIMVDRTQGVVKYYKRTLRTIYLLPDQQSFLPRDRHYLVLPWSIANCCLVTWAASLSGQFLLVENLLITSLTAAIFLLYKNMTPNTYINHV